MVVQKAMLHATNEDDDIIYDGKSDKHDHAQMHSHVEHTSAGTQTVEMPISHGDIEKPHESHTPVAMHGRGMAVDMVDVDTCTSDVCVADYCGSARLIDVCEVVQSCDVKASDALDCRDMVDVSFQVDIQEIKATATRQYIGSPRGIDIAHMSSHMSITNLGQQVSLEGKIDISKVKQTNDFSSLIENNQCICGDKDLSKAALTLPQDQSDHPISSTPTPIIHERLTLPSNPPNPTPILAARTHTRTQAFTDNQSGTHTHRDTHTPAHGRGHADDTSMVRAGQSDIRYRLSNGQADDGKFAGLAALLIDFHRSHKERHQASAKTIEELETVIYELKMATNVKVVSPYRDLSEELNEKLELFSVIKQESIDFLMNVILKRALLVQMSDFFASSESKNSDTGLNDASHRPEDLKAQLKHFILSLEKSAISDVEKEDVLQRAVDLDYASAYINGMCKSKPYTLEDSEFTLQGSRSKSESPIFVRINSLEDAYRKFDGIQQSMIACLCYMWSKANQRNSQNRIAQEITQLNHKIDLAEELSRKIDSIDSMIDDLSLPYDDQQMAILITRIEDMISYACAKSTETGIGSRDSVSAQISDRIKEIKMIKQSPLRTPTKNQARNDDRFEARRSTDIIMREAKVLFTQDSHPRDRKDQSSRRISETDNKIKTQETDSGDLESVSNYKRSLDKYKEIVRKYDDQLRRDTEYISKLKDDLKDCRVELNKKIDINRGLTQKVDELEDALQKASDQQKELEAAVDHGDIDKASADLSNRAPSSQRASEIIKDKFLILKLERGLLKVADYTNTLSQIAINDENYMVKGNGSLGRKIELLDKMINTLLCIINERKDEGSYKSSSKVDPSEINREDMIKKDLRLIPESQLSPIDQRKHQHEGKSIPHLEHMNMDKGDITFKGGEKTLFSESRCRAFIDGLPDLVRTIQDRLKRLLELRKANMLIDERVNGCIALLKKRPGLLSKYSDIEHFLEDSPLVSFHRRMADLQERFIDFMEGFQKKTYLLSQSMKESTHPRKDYLERLAAACK